MRQIQTNKEFHPHRAIFTDNIGKDVWSTINRSSQNESTAEWYWYLRMNGPRVHVKKGDSISDWVSTPNLIYYKP